MNLQELLEERKKTHGDYGDHARITQGIKDVMRAGPSYGLLHDHERETLDMLAHKIGRILAGDPHFEDHWRDMAGYATLSADRNLPKPLTEQQVRTATDFSRNAVRDFIARGGIQPHKNSDGAPAAGMGDR